MNIFQEFRRKWDAGINDWFEEAIKCLGKENDTQKAQPWEQFPKAVPNVDREEIERKGRALTTVNHDDFNPKPAPKTAEAD